MPLKEDGINPKAVVISTIGTIPLDILFHMSPLYPTPSSTPNFVKGLYFPSNWRNKPLTMTLTKL